MTKSSTFASRARAVDKVVAQVLNLPPLSAWIAAVSRVFNPLIFRNAKEGAGGLPIANRRSGRLQTCYKLCGSRAKCDFVNGRGRVPASTVALIDSLSGLAHHGRMRALARKEAVIFDMDGVLTDSEPLINAAAVAMFLEKGLTVQPEDFLPFVGTGEDRYLGGVAEKYHFPIDLPSAKKRTYEIYLDLVPARLQAFPGAQSLVRLCRQAGLKTAVASSADFIKIEVNLRKIDLPPDTWDAIVSAEDVKHKKPAPDIFLAAARKLGLGPAQCTVLEDAVNGIQAAKGAGMRCVAVAQTFPIAQLSGADLALENIAQVAVCDLVGN